MSASPVSFQSVQRIASRETLIEFLKNDLGWQIQEDVPFEDITYGWNPEEFGINASDLRGSEISQLRPFTHDQPWGIFFLYLKQPKLYITELRNLIRALTKMKRKLKD